MDDWQPLDRWINARMARDGTPGLGIAITDRDETRYLGTFGFADLAARTAVSPEHAFQNGSIGKTFTALLLLNMSERDEVDLNAPVNQYLTWFEAGNLPERITLHHLLTHTAGIIEGSDIACDGRFEAWALREMPLLAEPGERFAYSNLGYKILGYVIEEILGEPYSDAVTRRILEPLGMRESFSPITDQDRDRLAVGYRYAFSDRPWRPSHGLVPDTWIETGSGDGSIAVTTGDMAIFTRAILNRGAGIICDASFTLMSARPQLVVEDDPDSWYGYGLGSELVDGHRCYWHDGDMLGYFASMQVDPESGIGVSVLSNGPCHVSAIGAEALRFARKMLSEEAPYRLPEIVPLNVIEPAAELAGRYTNETETWTFVAEGDRLTLDVAGRSVPVERFVFGPRYVLLDPELEHEMLMFERDGDGAVTALHHGARWLGRSDREHPDPPPAPASWQAFIGWYQSHNPWQQRFQVYLRRGDLWINWKSGLESRLIEREPGTFQVGDSPSADRITFDAVADGQALRAVLNGQGYYRAIWSSLPSTRR